ncbi:MAG: LysR substrate-binding domain-containing protein [Immundisolibacteraceae bacterium]|nr:LysR substrate-binding domain-containing protein [Immundisolibacteraceae bacterium]
MSGRRLPTVKQLIYLVALEELRHFGHAAEQCFISQSAFSVAIRELENLVGVQLVDRTNKSVALTAEGSLFARRARAVVAEIEAMSDAVANAGEPLSGRLKLGVIPTIAPFLLPALLGQLRSHYPKLQLYIREEQTATIYQELLAGELDLLLLALPWPLRHAQTRELFSDPFRLAYRRGTKKIDTAHYDAETLPAGSVLLLEDGHCLRDHALSACQIGASSAINSFKGSSLQTLVQMVDADLGVTYLPEMACRSNLLAATDLQTQALDRGASREIGLAWRSGTAREQDFDLFAQQVIEVHRQQISIDNKNRS